MTYQKSKKSLSLKNLLIISIFFYMVAILIGSFSLFFDSNPLFDETTVILSLGIGLLLLFVVQFSRRYLFHQMAVIAFFFLVFILPRIVTYLFLPSIVIWPFGNDINAGTVNTGLLYVFTGTMFFIIGMTIADKVYQPQLPPSSAASGDPSYYSAKVLVTLFLVVFAFNLYVTHIMGISPYGKMRLESYNALFQFFKTIFELDSVFFLVFATLLFKKIVSGKSNWMAIIMVVLCYIFLSGLGGSRVGALRVIIFLVLALIAIGNNLRFRIRKLCMIFFILGAVGLLIFPFATISRISISSGSFDYAVAETRSLKTIKGLAARVLNRLGYVLDSPVLIVTQEGDPEAKAKYMNLLYPTKNIINMLVPGNPFPEAKIMTSRVIDVIYRGANEPNMYSRYFSEYWTLWGLAYVLFGWLGGILAILFIGFIIHSLYALIIMLFSGLYQFYLRLWLLLYVTQGIIGNMGFDSAFTTLFFGLLQFTALYYSLSLIKYFYGLFGGFLKQTVKPKAGAHRLSIPNDKLCKV